ncbi:tryptophan synthase alpha chain [Paenibacillus shirakamiensis]|uniref:Tryptophan synthase alpha chain n=1 Tax=Paenibacillus shirakamiensis TaxID=1265935 RepID=A0ABS4JCV6_9BACL|nr:tryptophan synthase subunit alpha [Paenibacillus shirakamiensis]MBP1999551.1 tryptophan synthase alpha chain [Paenibacillus shirakamiensis]
MNLIDIKFKELRENNATGLIPFITVGDPDLDTTLDLIIAMEQAGADILELGVPYSDPLADGPVIQRASERALAGSITIQSCIQIASKARQRGVKMPFVLFTYYNPVLQTGIESFFTQLKENGISGVIIPDLPIEESSEVLKLADASNIYLIPLVAPTSNERITRILANARGFIYCVSSLGVTGERASFHQGVEQFILDVKSQTELPVAVGFGISSREQVQHFSGICDGVVVGSAIVRKIEDSIPYLQNEVNRAEGLLQIREFVAQLKD